MKHVLMERADISWEHHPADKTRWLTALGLALGLHGLMFFMLSYVPQTAMSDPKAPISVQLVILEQPASPEVADLKSQETERTPTEPASVPPPTERPEQSRLSTENLVPTPDEPQPNQPDVETLIESTPLAAPTPSPLSILSTEDAEIGEPIPDRWRLPPGANIPLDKTRQAGNPQFEALAHSLDCLGFDAECAEQRKVIFSEDQLSRTDLVWMPSFAHSGLSNSDLYGLSESEIRERLGIPTAGANGLMLLPGIAINGPWWDALHGVNKDCDYGLGTNDLGQKQLVKSCKTLKPSSKDRIGFAPKSVE